MKTLLLLSVLSFLFPVADWFSQNSYFFWFIGSVIALSVSVCIYLIKKEGKFGEVPGGFIPVFIYILLPAFGIIFLHYLIGIMNFLWIWESVIAFFGYTFFCFGCLALAIGLSSMFTKKRAAS